MKTLPCPLEICSVSKGFGRPILQEASMAVPAGSGAVVAGENGAGKSTLLKMIAGLLLPDSGQIRCAGRPALRHRRALGYSPSTSAGFYRRLSPRQNLHYFGSLYGVSRARVDAFLRERDPFSISYWDAPSETLSDGMLQKVKLLRAFLHDPQVAILDEPLNYLDTASKQAFLGWLAQWTAAAPGRAYLIAQHSADLPGARWRIREGRLERDSP